nr:hypothetical protein CPGR_02081 [Mycolicibacterium komanii]
MDNSGMTFRSEGIIMVRPIVVSTAPLMRTWRQASWSKPSVLFSGSNSDGFTK